MKKSKLLAISAALTATAFFSTASSALEVDFTDENAWGNPGGSTGSYSALSADHTYGSGLEVIVTAPKVNLVSWESQDGFGVNAAGDDSNWDDDIENFNGNPITEILNVSFSSAQDVSRVRLADFVGTGQYSVGNGWVSIGPGNGINGPGEWFSIMAGTTSNIAFRALGGTGNSFQVSGLDVAAVPLPPAVWLLGSAMVFLFRKRQTS